MKAITYPIPTQDYVLRNFGVAKVILRKDFQRVFLPLSLNEESKICTVNNTSEDLF